MTWKAILELDCHLSKRLRIAEKPGFLRTVSIFLAHSGDSWFWGLGLVILWWFGQSSWKQRAVVLLGSIAVMAVLVLAIKFSVRRRRPEGDWGGIYRNTDPHSFPSGHAARSFLIAVLAIGLCPGWLAVVLSIWAPLVALARVAMGVHYTSDVVAGMILGIVVGIIVLQLYAPVLNWVTSLFGIALW